MIQVRKVPVTKAYSLCLDVANKLLSDLDTPKSLAVYIMLKYEQWNELVNIGVDPLDYDYSKYRGGEYRFQRDYQAVSFLKKADFLPLGIDRQKVALDKFLESEANCRRTNDRLSKSCTTGIKDRKWQRYVYVASQKISSILGPVPDYEMFDFAFGPGASSTCRGSKTSIADKFNSSISLTPNALEFWDKAKDSLPYVRSAANGLVIDGPVSIIGEVVETEIGNSLTFVPKNSKTDRCICVEPHTNILLQKGVGAYIRDRLKLNGLDLSKQDKINSEFAKIGSIDDSYATIDLSSASDSIAYNLVLELLPFEWFEVLDSLRSPFTQLPNKRWIVNEKFSSMGNGFTFEMETLIFYSLCLAVKQLDGDSSDQVMTFGDDIIVPSYLAETLIGLLEHCGFKTNLDKTFLSGPFRESCGKDYVNGRLVRPYFLKELPEYETDFIKIANGIRHFANRVCPFRDMCDSSLYRTWSWIVKQIPRSLRFYGPSDWGDQVIWSDRRSAYEQQGMSMLMRTKILVEVPRKRDLQRFPEGTQQAVLTYSLRSDLSCRGRSGRFKVRELLYSLWEWRRGEWS